MRHPRYISRCIQPAAALAVAAAFLLIMGCSHSDPPGPAAPANDPTNVTAGKDLYESQSCSTCHMINGKGGKLGPDLSNEANKGRSRQWLITKLKNPKANDPKSKMPPYEDLTDQQANDLASYMLSLSTQGK